MARIAQLSECRGGVCVCVCVCLYVRMSENMHVCTYAFCLKYVIGARAICELCMCVLHICTLPPLTTHSNHTFTVIATHVHVCTPTHFFCRKYVQILAHMDSCSHTHTQYTTASPTSPLPYTPATHLRLVIPDLTLHWSADGAFRLARDSKP